jgi:hypothetical protein
MLYEIQAEYLPQNDQLWVSFRTQDNTLVYQYETLERAEAVLNQLQQQDVDGRRYRIVQNN